MCANKSVGLFFLFDFAGWQRLHVMLFSLENPCISNAVLAFVQRLNGILLFRVDTSSMSNVTNHYFKHPPQPTVRNVCNWVLVSNGFKNKTISMHYFLHSLNFPPDLCNVLNCDSNTKSFYKILI